MGDLFTNAFLLLGTTYVIPNMYSFQPAYLRDWRMIQITEGKNLYLKKQFMLKKMLNSVPKKCLPEKLSFLLLRQTPMLQLSPHTATHMPGCYDN